MKRGMFLLVFFVAAMFAVTNTIQVYPGDCIIQEDLDDLGWHGELIVENVWETPIYMDVDLILRNGNSMMVDENIYMIKDTLGLTLNVISMIGDGSTLTGGKYSNPSGVGSGIYVDGIMNEISSVGVDGAVTGVYVNVGSQVDIEACNIDNTEIAMDLRHETSVDIRWTTIENSSQYAVLIHDNCDVYMQENIIHDSRVSVHGGRHSSVTIVDCEFDGEAYPFRGLDFDNTDYVHIQNSRISGDSVGIYAQYVDSLYVVNTIVEDVVLDGIWVNYSTFNIHNNNFVRCRNGIRVEGNGGIVYNNIFWRIQAPIYTPLSASLYVFTHNHFGLYEDETWNITTSSTASTYGNPDFADEANYNLESTSVCDGSGIGGVDRGVDRSIFFSFWTILENPDGMIESIPEEIHVYAYPSPFNGACHIDAPVGAEVKIYDLSGKEIAKNFGNIWMPSDGITSGVYLVKVRFDGKVGTARVIYTK